MWPWYMRSKFVYHNQRMERLRLSVHSVNFWVNRIRKEKNTIQLLKSEASKRSIEIFIKWLKNDNADNEGWRFGDFETLLV